MNDEIDFVITWVDSSDPKWQRDFVKYKVSIEEDIECNGELRYRDLELLRYMFRGFEQYTPWVRKIHFVTYGHVPEWFNLEHPKLNIVNHKDIFPDLNALPTFTSTSIEMCLHRIPDLAEKFVYFNDDMFLIDHIPAKRFFHNNLPNDHFLFYMLFNDGRFSHMLHTNMSIINDEVPDKNKFLRNNFFKIYNFKYGLKNNLVNIVLGLVPQFSLLKIYHHPQPHLKSNFLEVEEKYGEEMDRVRKNRFRSFSDLNQYLFRFWGLIKGKFNPYLPKDSLYCGINSSEDIDINVSKIKKNPKLKFVCFNEELGIKDAEFKAIKSKLQSFFEDRMAEKSTYEL